MAGGFDIAVCGSTPLAKLLAGIVAAEGKRVCLIGDSWSPYRLMRRIDLSVMPVTRPETWALLKKSGAETLKLLGGFGRGLYERVDPLFVAETSANTDRLGHMRWTAVGFGFAAERAIDRTITEIGAIVRIRDAAMLAGGRAETALEVWLDKSEVRRLASDGAEVSLRRDGSATITASGASFDVPTIILADSAAILRHLPPADYHRLLDIVPMTSLITEPAKPLSATLVDYLDRGLTVHQRALKGGVAVLCEGSPETALPRAGAILAGLGRLRRAGQAAYRDVQTTDRAPLIGKVGKSRATIVAGLGVSGAFLAPAVARYLLGTASDEERAYFEPRDVSRAGNRQSVAESAPLAETAA